MHIESYTARTKFAFKINVCDQDFVNIAIGHYRQARMTEKHKYRHIHLILK